jgi:hypothetical protein
MKRDLGMKLGRRGALRLLGAGAVTAGGLLAVGSGTRALAQAPGPSPAGPLCKDKVPIDDVAKAMRRTLQYQEKSTRAGKTCLECAQFEDGKYSECGGCKLMGGAVSPGGSCLSFAPRKAPATPPATPAR